MTQNQEIVAILKEEFMQALEGKYYHTLDEFAYKYGIENRKLVGTINTIIDEILENIKTHKIDGSRIPPTLNTIEEFEIIYHRILDCEKNLSDCDLSNISKCAFCGAVLLAEDYELSPNDLVACEDCGFTCSSCDRKFPDDERPSAEYEDYNGSIIDIECDECLSCMENSYYSGYSDDPGGGKY